MTTISATRDDLRGLADAALLATTHRLAVSERRATADVVAAIAEVDERRLYLGEGCRSMFTFCTERLHFSEQAAYARIEAARASRRFPVILQRLSDGTVTLTAVGLLTPHLTEENHQSVLTDAQHKSKREVELLVARLRPLPDVPSLVRRLPSTNAVDAPRVDPIPAQPAPPTQPVEAPARLTAPTPPKRAVVAPLSPERFKLQVTISREAHDHLRRAQDLLRHTIPNGDPALVVERALKLLAETLERTKLATVTRPRPARRVAAHSRHIPAAVRREVWARDAGRCAFVGRSGRCSECGDLEIHHVIPFADGGRSEGSNLQLRCRMHNAFEAHMWSDTSGEPVSDDTGA